MRKLSRGAGLVASSCFVCALSGVANAAPPAPPPPGAARSSSQFTLHRDEAGGADGALARQRARAGDCAGALPAFDMAVRATIEPSLRRDRGLCHEKLGHPFPAIDDYRAYLTARPEAADADQIRARLAQLEQQAGVIQAEETDDGKSTPASTNGAAALSVGTGGVTASSYSYDAPKKRVNVIGPKAGEPDRSYDYYAAEERAMDSAEASALRYGTGPILGAFVMVPRFALGGNKPSGDMGYVIGGTLRYSTSKALTLISEFGYTAYGRSGQNTSSGGPLALLGVELRIPIAKLASDQFLVGGGIGYEHFTVSGTKSTSDHLGGRFRLGFRHVFGPQLGFELLADGGPMYNFQSSNLYGVVGGSFAFVVAF